MNREEIEAMFQDVAVDGIGREVVFLPESEEGYIEVKLVDNYGGLPPVHLSFPDDDKK